jgi:hypothetical protein
MPQRCTGQLMNCMFSVKDGGQRVPVSRCKHAAALHWLADKLYVQREGRRAAGASVAVQAPCSTALSADILYVSAWRMEGSGCQCRGASTLQHFTVS